ncbi:MAG: response regulator [Gammaproteobacteria bacterium]|nr:MAG: response regulator [Gammaproteobacteria bacterium]
MSLPVLVVDDSGMSRKLTIRALPKEWDIEISQAANGFEALEAYHDGKAHVMFLDLTMPGMDGFEVLETLQREGLDCFVIVVSADVQPEAEIRAKELGAMAFIRKPINSEKVIEILSEYGIYEH